MIEVRPASTAGISTAVCTIHGCRWDGSENEVARSVEEHELEMHCHQCVSNPVEPDQWRCWECVESDGGPDDSHERKETAMEGWE